MTFCSRCGKENDDSVLSCGSCGAPLRKHVKEAAPFPVAEWEENRTQPLTQTPWTKNELEGNRPQPLMAVGEKRDSLLVLVLGFVTCYVYLFYWWYVTAADIKRATARADINPPLELVLNLLTCSLFSIYLSYKYPKIILEMQEQARVVRNDTSLLSVLLSIFSLGPIACYVIQVDLNRIWETLEAGNS